MARMQQIDRAAIETVGIPRLLLMEHAGFAVARAVQAICPTPPTPILVCCGTGFNGGDGFAAARHLSNWGYPLRILVTARVAHLREEPAVYATIIQRLGLPILELTANEPRTETCRQLERWLDECGLLVDALLGIGVSGSVREPTASVITRMNRSGKPIVAVDIPSGLDGDTGVVRGVAVKAVRTITFGLIKQGCLIHKGPAHCGKILVDPITMPPTLLATVRTTS